MIHDTDISKWPAATFTKWSALINQTPTMEWNRKVVDLAKTTLAELLQADARVLSDPPAQIVVGELADNSVNLKVRAWTASADYWDVFFDMQEAVKKRFDAAGLEIPFPQRDVYLHTVKD